MARTPCCDKSGLKKGTWTPEEDRKLVAYVTRYGCWNWRQMPKFAGLSRCGKSCRLRWMNYLRPNIKRGNYTKEEEETIIRLHETLGNRWSAIAAQLPGRTDNEIKNHWHTNLKKRNQQDRAAHELKSNTEDQIFQHELNQNEQSITSEGNCPNVSAPLIVESYFLSSQPSSSDFSSISSDSTFDVTSTDLISKDEFGFLENYEIPMENNFWTTSFLDDNCYTPNELLSPLVEPQYSSFFDGEAMPVWFV